MMRLEKLVDYDGALGNANIDMGTGDMGNTSVGNRWLPAGIAINDSGIQHSNMRINLGTTPARFVVASLNNGVTFSYVYLTF